MLRLQAQEITAEPLRPITTNLNIFGRSPGCGPIIVKPDYGDPDRHKYLLQSHKSSGKPGPERKKDNLPLTGQANTVMDEVSSNVQKYQLLVYGTDKETQKKSLAKKLGRLTQDIGNHILSGTSEFPPHPSHTPKDLNITYSRTAAKTLLHK